ncbi:MAG: hypothetical protein HY825_13630 [Acidobacteria bacterium]|nr:hypothetical protein [Acidobacteriota bacterium]
MKRTRLLAAVAALAVLCAMSAAATDYTYSGPVASAVRTIPLQAAAATGNGNTWNTRGAINDNLVFVAWSAGCSAGVVTIETAETAAYAGTWAPLTTVSWSAASKTDVVQIIGPIGVIRARISTAVVGGTVTVTAYGR